MAWHSGQAYAQDLRDRVLAADGTIHEIAKRFAVSDSSLQSATRTWHGHGASDAGWVKSPPACNAITYRCGWQA